MLKYKRLFLFDIDGVIRLGDKIIDGSIQLYDYIKKIGGKSIFITNNSTKGARDYVQTFKNYGFDVDESNFLTALTITVDYLKKHHSKDLIYVMGTNSLFEELVKNDLNATKDYNKNIKVALVGYDNELTFDKVVTTCKVLQTLDVTYLATNVDLKCPVSYGFIPDCGGIVKFIEIATDKEPKFLGKPAPEMVFKALEVTNFNKEQTLVIGDRFYTDIACGINAGVDTCAVLTGEINKDDIKTTSYKPTYIFDSVKELLDELIR